MRAASAPATRMRPRRICGSGCSRSGAPRRPSMKSRARNAGGATRSAHKPGKAPAAPAKKSPRPPPDAAEVRFTHPERVYWVDVGVTKEDLGAYYHMVWNWMAPHVIGRPLALVRCPDGTKGE